MITQKQQDALQEIEAADSQWFAKNPGRFGFDRAPYTGEIELVEKLKMIKPQASNRVSVLLLDGKIIRGYITA